MRTRTTDFDRYIESLGYGRPRPTPVQTNNVRSGGVSFLGLLALLFIGLKLGGVITWPWWLVLLPLYGPAAIFLGIVALGLGFIALGALAAVLVAKGERIARNRKAARRK